MKKHEYDIEQTEEITSAKKVFLIYSPGSNILNGREFKIPLPSGKYEQIGKAFEHNLKAILSTLSIPSNLAFESVSQLHWQKFKAIEGMKSLLITEDSGIATDKLEEHRAQVALENAKIAMADFIASKEGGQNIYEQTCKMLMDSIKNPHMEVASKELLRQGIVLLWSAFEVLSRDLFIAIINSNPEKVNFLLSNPETKSKFELKSLKIDIISDYGYDLSTHMGDILASANDLSDLSMIKSIYQTLFSNDQYLKDVLANRNLWILNNQRNLIVHQRGIVDSKYLEKTADNLNVGDTLIVTIEKFREHFFIIVDIGSRLLSDIESGA